MGNKHFKPSPLDYLLIEKDIEYPPNIVPVHVWKIKCLTERRDVFYVSEQCPHYCPYGKDHEINLTITRMKPCDMVMDK